MRIMTINNETVVIGKDWSIIDAISARTTMQFRVVDLGNLTEINVGNEISFTDGAMTYFKGTVEAADDFEISPGQLEYYVTGVDFNQLADKRTIAASYTDELAGTIVADFITQKLSQEGVWYNPSALSFDGVDDYVSLASASVTTKFTMECWLKNDEVVKDVMFISGASPTYFRCLNGKLLMSIVLGGVQTTLAGLTSLTQGSWHHVAFSYDGVDMKVYLDGILDNSAPKTTALTSFNILRIGRWIDTDQRSLNGTLDDIRIWNVARTQTEIQADMNKELIGNEAGLVGYWKFNEGSGLVAIDSTANGNNGTISGATYVTDNLWSQGIIQDGNIIKIANFNYDTISIALDKIKDITGYVWNIDFDKKLNYFERSTNTAPFALDDTVQHSNFRRTKTRVDYRNRQYIRGGKGKTAVQTKEKPSPAPDGVSKKFFVRFGIAEKPRIFVNDIEVNQADIGVNGLDENKKWYFSYDSNMVIQDDAETELIATDKLEVTYIGLRRIMVVADEPTKISERKDKEAGTSGIYESMKQEKSINDSSAAIELAQGLILKYGDIPSIVTFNTQVNSLKSGQLLPIQKDLYGINDSFLIESINIYLAGNDVEFSIKCLDGSAIGGWEQFFKEIIGAGKDFFIEGNEVIVLLNVQAENTGYQGEVNIKVYDALYPADNLYPADDLYPGTLAQEVIKND